MTVRSKASSLENRERPVRTILISQPKPERSPYFDLEKKYGVKIDFRKFIQVEPVSEKEFRKTKIRPEEYSAVIFTSKNAIVHYFRMCEAMRIDVDPNKKYFCLTEAIANYLQKFITYRKRKVFVGNRHPENLERYFQKFKDKESFLLPISNLGSEHVCKYLREKNIPFQEAMMFRTVASDLSDLANIKYDVLVFFSPLGIKSLYHNFPNFEQNETRLAVYGQQTTNAVKERGLIADIVAPVPDCPSMHMALKHYIERVNS